MDPGDVEYEPVSVKLVLAEMKDTSELIIDLAYSAVLHGSEELAEEVLELEAHMDILQLRARMGLLLAARTPEDAEALAPVLGVVGAAEKISNAAGEIAHAVLSESGIPDEIKGALPEAIETIARAEVHKKSPFCNSSLGKLNLETDTGIRIIGIRRKGNWVYNPGPKEKLRADDVILLRGPEERLVEVYENATKTAYELPTYTEPDLVDLERAVDSIVLMKNMSELAVDLAYGAVLFNSEDVAEEVFELEAEVDALQSRFEAWTLRAAASVEDPIRLRGLVHLARATEEISDAALEIADGVLRGLAAHPVVAEAVQVSDEIIVRITLEPGCDLNGKTLGECELSSETGMRVLAIRRANNSEWLLSPNSGTGLEVGDVLVAKGTRLGAERIVALVS